MLSLLVVGAVFLVLAWGVLWPNSSLLVPTLARGPRGQPRVALTFDDGPDPRITPLVLDLLAGQDVQATFFCIGALARRHPELVRRIHREGHLVANHSLGHDWRMNFWFPRRVLRSIAGGGRILRRLTGVTPLFYRAPVGIKSPAQALMGWKLGIAFVGWTRSARDGGPFLLRPDALRRLGARSRPGDILLLHDGKWGVADDAPALPTTREVYAAHLPALIEGLRGRGLEPVRLDELLGAEASLAPADRRLRKRLFTGGWVRTSRNVLRHLATEHATPSRLALATALGVFVGSSPLFGLHAPLGLLFAVRLRLNKLAVFLGTNISNPVTGPLVIFANIQTGCRLLTGHWLGSSVMPWASPSLASWGNKILLYWVVGFPVASSAVALAAGLVSYPVFCLGRSRAAADGSQ